MTEASPTAHGPSKKRFVTCASMKGFVKMGCPEAVERAPALCAKFWPGHLPGQRGARGPLAITDGTLLLVDESKMILTPTCAVSPPACAAKTILPLDS
jgi:hypothetical protein